MAPTGRTVGELDFLGLSLSLSTEGLGLPGKALNLSTRQS